jgi:hypothetical protein
MYWTEHNPGGKKMRFEMQKVFDIHRRILTWKRNQTNFNKNAKPGLAKNASDEDLINAFANFRRNAG